MQITIQPALTVDLNSVVIEYVRDNFTEQTISAKIKGLPRSVALWSGETEYAAASAWDNDSAATRALEVLALPNIPWAN